MKAFKIIDGLGARCAALLLAALLPAAAFASITQSINYQGFLISKVTNLPVETPPDIKFVIYNSPVAGSALFTESRCNMPITKGRYDVEIGSVTAGGLPGSLFTDYNGLWLEIQVDENGDCLGVYEAMSPRVKLQASPYAFNSLYASTASAATSVFAADTIAALPQTTYGAITISTNLFVQGGISVGSISPGQKLAVAGVVESTGVWPSCAVGPNYACGFKFPDGSVQVKAAALTMWDVLGPNLYTINEGNTSVGGLTVPQARLHISSAAGDAGTILLVSTGTGAAQSPLFSVNGLGEVYGGSYYGNGASLANIVRSTGDVMTGQLTMAGSSLTVTAPAGAWIPKLKLRESVEISSASAAFYGGVFISSNVYASGRFYGDGSGLTDVISFDSTKVLKAGDTMTGQLTLAGSTLTVSGGAFSVAGATFTVLNGLTSVGSAAYLARLTVGGGIVATSSITSQTSMHAASFNSPAGFANLYNVTAASGTFWGVGPAQYSVETSSTIKVNSGLVIAPLFSGDGSQLTNVTGTDPTKLLKGGDIMTGNLRVSGSSLTVADAGAHPYAFTVSSVPAVNRYSLVVTTGGKVGVQVLDPAAPLEVNEGILISNGGGPASLHLKSYGDYSFIRWTEDSQSASPGGPSQGVLGYDIGLNYQDLVYRTRATTITDGTEVFRIKSDDSSNWRFGLGTNSPAERFHVATGLLVSSAAATPIFYASTSTARVGVRTLSPTHALTVNGGILAVSSVTAQGGFYGSGAGLTNLPAGAIPESFAVSTITAVAGTDYDGVIFSTSVYIRHRLAVGYVPAPEPNFVASPDSAIHVRGKVRLDQSGGEDVILHLKPNFSGDAYLLWDDGTSGVAGVLGVDSADRDLIYRAGIATLGNGANLNESFRIKPDGKFIMGNPGSAFVPFARFQVVSDMLVAAAGSSPVLFISTASGSVGVSTGTPKERTHIGSSLLVGGDRNSAALYVSTQSGYTGVGTGYPAEGLHSARSFLVGPDRTIAYLYVSTQSGYTGVGTSDPQAKLHAAGYALFNSSLTVSGGGLAGTEDVLNVKSGALLVRNDDRVGIGIAPDERLHVNGKVQATGFKASREIITGAACMGAATCQASCTAGKLVMGGGCSYATGTDYLTGSFPADADTWQCDYSGPTGDITPYAICSTVE